MAFTLKINGTPRDVDVDGDTPLLWVLRDVLGMTGTKFGCGQALCGARTVHADGAATRSCITTVDSIGESAITTIEAIGQTPQVDQAVRRRARRAIDLSPRQKQPPNRAGAGCRDGIQADSCRAKKRAPPFGQLGSG